MMKQAIENFAKQFAWQPQIDNEDKLMRQEKIIICGMGGSHLAADILKDIRPDLRIRVHRSYGLPQWSLPELKKSLIILSSYSGNTEEVLDAYQAAKKSGLAMAVISVGGKLIDLAQSDGVAFVRMPDTGIQPRLALGFSFLGLLKLLGLEELQAQAKELSGVLEPKKLAALGQEMAEKIYQKVPVVYSSENNYSVAYNWKIKLNETGKIPAFYNLLPELNHNEMNGFDVKDSIRDLASVFCFIFLKDSDDHPRIAKRFEVLQKLYKDRRLSVMEMKLEGANRLEKIFSSLLLADWTAYYIADKYGLESEQVPMVEEFKKMIKDQN